MLSDTRWNKLLFSRSGSNIEIFSRWRQNSALVKIRNRYIGILDINFTNIKYNLYVISLFFPYIGILSTKFQYNSRVALSCFFDKSTVAEHLNLAKFRWCPAQCHLNLEGYHFPYKCVCTHRSSRADLPVSYFDLFLILTSILISVLYYNKDLIPPVSKNVTPL